MELFDTHSHIYLPEFDADRDAVVERARQAGVAGLILPNVDLTTVEPMLSLAAEHPGWCFPAMALHPTEVGPSFRADMRRVEELLAGGGFVAVGECGLDFYWDRTYAREQQAVFDCHLQWASQFGLPLIIHGREAFLEIITAVEAAQHGQLTGVFHCFSGTPDEARRVVDAGFAIGVGGVLTYKKSTLGDAVRAVGLEQVLLETDAPYLAPVPFRGRRNESAYVACVAQKLSELLDVAVEEVAAVTTRHARRLFLGDQQLQAVPCQADAFGQ